MSSSLLRSLEAVVALAVAIPVSPARAQAADTTSRVSVGGFVDAYFAWDFGRPPSRNRSFAGGAPFTTQPARHNEFNVNLGFADVRLDGQSVRGRVAIQMGTSVQVKYAAESLSVRYIQEAVGGVRVHPGLWIDAGIFLSHIGMESWISRDNPTYTRSLVAEYSPYYQSGVKATWETRSGLSAQLHVVNGWQNISDNDGAKGVGARIDWTPVSSVLVSGYNLLSKEEGGRLRSLHGVGAKGATTRFTWLLEADFGMQASSNSIGQTAHWYGFAGIGRMRLSRGTALSARLEHFDDDEQIVIETGSNAVSPNPPFRGSSASMGVDVAPHSKAIWRSELRQFWNSARVFSSGGAATPVRTSAFAVTSLAVTF